MRAALVLTFVAIGIVAALRSRFYGLLLYLWFALFRPQEWTWGAVDPYRLSLVIGGVLVIPSILTGIFPNVTHVLSLGSVAFLGAATVAHQFAPLPEASWFALDQLARVILISLLLVTLVNTRRRFLIVIAVVAGSIGIHAAKLGIVFLLRGGARFTSGIGGTFGDNNDLGLGIVRVIPLMLICAQLLPWRSARWAFRMAIPLAVLAVVGTYSRGAFLGLAAAVVTYLLLQRRVLSVISVAAVTFAIAWWAPIPQDYLDRLRTIQTYDEIGEASAQSRPHFWRTAILVAEDNPLGIGLRNFEEVYDTYDTSGGAHGVRRSVHSTHLQILAETGYAGFTIYVIMLVASGVILLRTRRRSLRPDVDPETRRLVIASTNGLIASMAAFFVGGTFLAQALNDLNWITFAFVAALDRLPLGSEQEAAAPTPALSGTQPAWTMNRRQA